MKKNKSIKYLRKPTFEKQGVSSFDLYIAEQESKKKEKEKITKDYAKQQAKIELGLLKSQRQAEFDKLISADTTKRQKLQPLRINPMSEEQNLLGSLFGGGDKVLFNNPESDSLPKLNGALMRNKFVDEDETAETFGFGQFKSRSGLF